MATHCTLEDLLAMRDGEGTAAARRHVEECGECRSELDRLHQRVAALKALPALRPPRDRWPEVRSMLSRATRRRRWASAAWTSVGAAAVMAAFVGIRAVERQQGSTAQGPARVDSLVLESQRLEEALRALDPTSRVLSGRAANTIAQIEDRIALLDAQLADAQGRGAAQTEMARLWQERVQLMDALVKVHVTRAAYVGL